jgi:putative ABC transport system permease protein
VLSDAFWRTRLDADPTAIGRTLTVDGQLFEIVGVLPSEYRPVTTLDRPDLYVPVSALVLPSIDDRSNTNALAVIGRLRPGTTAAQAQAAVTALGRSLEGAYPRENERMGQPGRVYSFAGGEMGQARDGLALPAILFTIFGLVLLSACANVAGLLMARVANRQRELAVRVAMGAGRGRLIRMLLAESLGLAFIGTAVGALLSVWLTGVLRTVVVPGGGTVDLVIQTDAALGLYALALVLTVGVLCGIAPAHRALGFSVAGAIQSGDTRAASGRLRLRHAFVVGQVAISLTLLVLSALLLRTVNRVASFDVGFDLDRGVVAMVHVPASRYSVDGGLPIGERIVERLAGVPGVEASSFANIVALGSDASAARLQVEGQSESPGPRAFVNSVAPRYFETLGIPILRGRDFDARDRPGSSAVAIVSDAFARAYFPDEETLGRRVRRSIDDPYAEIVGIVADSNYRSPGEPPAPLFYSAYAQQPQVSTQIRPVVLHVRTAFPGAVMPELRRVIREVVPAAAADVMTLREATGREAQLREYGAQVLGFTSGLALLLATLGLYGLLAFVVSSRTGEIGTRMALGAASSRILRNVLADGLRLAAYGIAIGALVSFMLARALRAALAGLSPADPLAFGGAAIVLVVVCTAATVIPAYRAAALNPVEALRVE